MLKRAFSYFRRGHTIYISLLIALTNFTTIQYQLLVKKVPWLAKLFPNMYVFASCSLLIYIPFAVLLGKWDSRHVSLPHDAELQAKASPYAKDMAKAMIYLANQDYKKVEALMRQWTGE